MGIIRDRPTLILFINGIPWKAFKVFHLYSEKTRYQRRLRFSRTHEPCPFMEGFWCSPSYVFGGNVFGRKCQSKSDLSSYKRNDVFFPQLEITVSVVASRLKEFGHDFTYIISCVAEGGFLLESGDILPILILKVKPK